MDTCRDECFSEGASAAEKYNSYNSMYDSGTIAYHMLI